MAEAAVPYRPLHDTRSAAWIARVAAFSALAIVGRVAFLWAPNYALTYLIVFLAGLLDGRRTGALVGLLAMTVTNLFASGLHPVLLANGLAMALLGVLGGSVRPLFLRPARDRLDHAVRVATLALVGLFGTFLFSVTSDLVGFFMMFVLTPEGSAIGAKALGPLVLAGLVFNLGPAVMNMLLFVAVTVPLVETLRKAGHVREGSRTRASDAA